MAPLPTGFYNISNGKETSSYLTFPDKAGGDVKMTPKDATKRQKVRVTLDERGYEFEIDAIGGLDTFGVFLPYDKMVPGTKLQASLEHRTLFQVEATGAKDSYTIRMLNGSPANLAWESNGTDPVWVQAPATTVTAEQTWIFTPAK